jgi:MFS family permease
VEALSRAATYARLLRLPSVGRLISAALAGAGMRTVVAGAAGFGLTFGVLDVAFPAVGRADGSVAGSGILLSVFAAGSWVGGFLYGLRAREGRAGRRYPWLALLGALGLAPLALLPGLGVMVLLAAVAGLLFAPITTTQMAIIDELAEPAHRGEAYSWLGTLYGAGVAAGAALAGQLIAGPGLRAALLCAAGTTLLAALTALARAGTLTPVAGPSLSR